MLSGHTVKQKNSKFRAQGFLEGAVLEGWEQNVSEGRTFLLPTHNAEVMMYSHCPLKGNLNLTILLSVDTENLGL